MEERNEIKHVVEAMYKIMIAIQSMNPDPTETIGDYRKKQKFTRTMLFVSVGTAVVSSAIALLSLGVSIIALYKVSSVGILLKGN